MVASQEPVRALTRCQSIGASTMLAIAILGGFLTVMTVLNIIDFGRID
jgi:hypothetical protein